jgi:hypothetical protein
MRICERLRLYYMMRENFGIYFFHAIYINARQKIDNSNMLPSAQTRL